MKLLFPLLFTVTGLGAGAAGGYFVPLDAESIPFLHQESVSSIEMLESYETPTQIVKLNNQFIVPVIEDDGESSLVIMSLSLEVTEEKSDSVFDLEPRLRDVIMKVLFEHSSHGGFSGRYYTEDKMSVLRKYLLESTQSVIGPEVHRILITDLVRQSA